MDDVIPAVCNSQRHPALPFRAPLSRKWLFPTAERVSQPVRCNASPAPSSSQCPVCEGRPTNRRHVSCFAHYAALFPSPDWAPARFNWRRNPPPRQIEFGPFPGCEAGTPDTQERIVNVSSSCWPAITRPHRGATEIDQHRDLVPARQPGKQALARLMFCGD